MANPDALRRLAFKYATIASLRHARAQGELVPLPAVFQALAGEFPGALNELDSLPPEEAEARSASLLAAAEGAPAQPWMQWMADYHALMRAALHLKRRGAAKAAVLEAQTGGEAALLRAAEEATAHAGLDVDAAFVRAVASPPEGRLNRVVFERLASRYALPAGTIKRALFPRSRLP